MNKKHSKHTKLTKPTIGDLGRFEIAITGLNCFKLKQFSSKLNAVIQHKNKIIYVDEQHKNEREGSVVDVFTQTENGANLKVNYPRKNIQNKILFYDYDLLLLNGNHFQTEFNILIIDESRVEKLITKINTYQKVLAVVITNLSYDLPEIIKDKIEENNAAVFVIHEIEKIASFISSKIKLRKPKLNGLILAGGKSSRMGEDKSEINYYGKPHKHYLSELMNDFCDETFLSYDTIDKAKKGENFIVDEFQYLGPIGAMLTAFKTNPNCAWLVLACDLPLMTKETIAQLIENRNASKIATAFLNDETQLPEPLVTIWEPKSYKYLLNFLALGYSCPRKILINAEIELIKPKFPKTLQNVNFKEESEAILKHLKK